MELVNTEEFWNKLKLTLIGAFGVIGILLFIILSLPVFIYRWIICHVVVPLFKPEFGSVITGPSLCFAFEFDKNSSKCFRSNICANFITESEVSYEEYIETFQSKVIEATVPKGDSLLYPKLQQCIVPFMQFMFWKQDKNFNIKNHVKLHKLSETGTELDSKIFFNNFLEELVNRPFSSLKSPWEVHLVQNYKNKEISNDQSKLTLIFIRLHHTLADGFSLMHLVAALNGSSFEELKTPSSPHFYNKTKIKQTISEKVKTIVKLYLKLVQGLGSILLERCTVKKTPFYVDPTDLTPNKLICSRSKLVPVQMIKDLKNKHGVNFTSVIASSISGAVAENFRKFRSNEDIEDFLGVVVCPMPNHPLILDNHASCASVHIHTDPTVDVIDRLHLTDKRIAEQNESMQAIVLFSLANLITLHLNAVVKTLVRNREYSLGMSNVPGPAIQLGVNGKKYVRADFATGTHLGSVGITFNIASYRGNISIVATANKDVLARQELDHLVETVVNEIQKNYKLTFSKKFI